MNNSAATPPHRDLFDQRQSDRYHRYNMSTSLYSPVDHSYSGSFSSGPGSRTYTRLGDGVVFICIYIYVYIITVALLVYTGGIA